MKHVSMTPRIIFSFLFMVLISASCNKEEVLIVNEEMIPYYEIFKEEAAKRGIVFDNSIEKIEGHLEFLPKASNLGICRTSSNSNSKIIIDKPYWRISTNLDREFIMFHEFGHCFLKLDHDDSQDNMGDCVSIMASGIGDCKTNYNQYNRDSLITELFAK